MGRERGRPRGQPVRGPRRRQAGIRRGPDGAARGVASLARSRTVAPVTPRPAASVLLVRPGVASPAEVYMIRRQKSMRFLGGFYAFPGGKVDPEDGAPEMRARCCGLTAADAERLLPSMDGAPALAYGVAAARELLEETGVLPACDTTGQPVGVGGTEALARIEAMRDAHMAKRTPLAALLAERGWYLELDPLPRPLLPRPRADRPESSPLSRRGVGELLGRARGGIPPTPERGVGHGRACRLRPRLSRPVRLSRCRLGRARGSPPQVPRHLRSRGGGRRRSPPRVLASRRDGTRGGARRRGRGALQL